MISVIQFPNDVERKYVVTVRIADLILEKLTKEQFRDLVE